MLFPKSLKIGDTIAIISTARKVTTTELAPSIAIIKSWGFKVVLGKTIEAESNQFAGDDALRTADLQAAMDDDSIAAIWCARGGYGTVRIVDGLDFTKFKKHPKWIIGYSDVTVLHNHLCAQGVASIHGQMCLELDRKSQASRETIKEILFGNFKGIHYASNGENFGRNGNATGTLIGGNLSVLYAILGSASEVDFTGKILFIEDLDEMLYHIDRMMQSLKRSGILGKISGLIVGGMNDMRDNTIAFGQTANEIVSAAVSAYHYPVCYGFPAGHLNDNRALIMGADVLLKVNGTECVLEYK
ncbi:putative carboxypeptidase [unidentified eubacterium SCB49]|nr:putative carboxypeptidase [unidentified eubacterium SCB49]